MFERQTCLFVSWLSLIDFHEDFNRDILSLDTCCCFLFRLYFQMFTKAKYKNCKIQSLQWSTLKSDEI